ncbi:MAG: glutathione S-transferase family protein [bacterium]
MSREGFNLIIGNKNLSSWSLRPWLVMKQFNIPFRETLIRLDVADSKKQLLNWSPNGLVPCLQHGDQAIWDSLAICEYLADIFPEKNLWPEDIDDRARARCVSHEMHAGFTTLRTVWPMEFCRARAHVWGGPGVRKDIAHILNLLDTTLFEFGEKKGNGPFLFGTFSIADAFYAPVISRFNTYGPVKMPSRVVAYMDTIWSLPALQEWGDGARHEVTQGWYD